MLNMYLLVVVRLVAAALIASFFSGLAVAAQIQYSAGLNGPRSLRRMLHPLSGACWSPSIRRC